MKMIILLGAVAALVGACASGKVQNGDATVTKCDSTVQVITGSKVKVVLASNMTTGYSWALMSQSAELMSQDGKDVYERTGPAGLEGSGGTQTFTFIANKVGNDTLTLHYRRSWEKDKPPAEVCRVFINIVDK